MFAIFSPTRLTIPMKPMQTFYQTYTNHHDTSNRSLISYIEISWKWQRPKSRSHGITCQLTWVFVFSNQLYAIWMHALVAMVRVRSCAWGAFAVAPTCDLSARFVLLQQLRCPRTRAIRSSIHRVWSRQRAFGWVFGLAPPTNTQHHHRLNECDYMVDASRTRTYVHNERSVCFLIEYAIIFICPLKSV